MCFTVGARAFVGRKFSHFDADFIEKQQLKSHNYSNSLFNRHHQLHKMNCGNG